MRAEEEVVGEDSSSSSPVGPFTVVHLLPEEIVRTDVANVRKTPGAVESEGDMKALRELKESIELVGQLQPVTVNLNKQGKYELIFGNRRLDAIQLHNMELEDGEEKMRVAALVKQAQKNGTMFQSAAHENLHRKRMSDVEFAYAIKDARSKSKATGWKQTEAVAKFFGVAPATITETEKILELDEDTQIKIHMGIVSKSAVPYLREVPEAERPEVIQEAAEESAQEEAEGVGRSKKKGKIKTRAIAKAVSKRVPEGSSKPNKRNRTELLSWFESENGPGNGHENGAPRSFLVAFMKYADGLISDAVLKKSWDALCKDADKGSPSKKAAGSDTGAPTVAPGNKAKTKSKKAARRKK